jgi:lipopolysaccharide export system ATP-binding protein
MSERRLEGIVAATGAGGVSALIALRALAAADDGAEPVERSRWLTLVGEQYRRWFPAGDAVPENFPAGDTERYLDQGALGQLATAGLVEFLGGGEGEPVAPGADHAWSAARLVPWAVAEVQHDRGLLERIDARIGALVADTAAPAAVDGVSAAPPSAADGASAAPPSAAEGDGAAAATAAVPARRSQRLAGGLTLSARGLVKQYRGRRVVNDVDVHVAQGEIVGLLGPNGAGKTTSFYMIVGLIRPDRGQVFIGDRNLTGVPMYRRARAGIGYLAQEPSVFRRLTVEENVLAILQMMKLPRAEQKRRLELLLDELGIKHLRKTRAYALSGGERRRLEITRALVSEPRFMLLDEPFAGVDPIAVHDIQQIVSDLRRRGIGVLISDHNVEQTLDIVDRAYIMYEGRVRVSGTVSELVWNDEVAEIYLGPTLTARMRERYDHPESEDAA